jgi:hypothetical protein
VSGHPYRDEDNQPILRDSWVLYLDALGTSEAAKSLTNERLRARISPEVWYHRFLHHGNEMSYQRALYFTDNVVVAMPADDQALINPVQGVGALLQSAATYIVGAAIEDHRACRGAIAFGPAYVDNDVLDDDELAMVQMAHGPGLIDAVHTEEKLAIFPRLVVTESTLTVLARLADRPGHLPPMVDLLRGEADHLVFLDHLGSEMRFGPSLGIRGPGHPEGMALADLMAEYRSFIVEGLALTESIRTKYEWLSRYYNYTVDQFEVGARLEGPSDGFSPVTF